MTFTGLTLLPGRVSSWPTAVGKPSAIAVAMAWACAGLLSRTATSMSTVSGGVVAVT